MSNNKINLVQKQKENVAQPPRDPENYGKIDNKTRE